MREVALIHDSIHMILKQPELHTVTAFCSPLSNVKERVRITRHKKRMAYHLEIGRPNYAERQYLKRCKKAKRSPSRFLFKLFAKVA